MHAVDCFSDGNKVKTTAILYTVTLPHNFAHGINIQLSCHVQNFIAITLLQLAELKEKFHQIWITMEISLVKWAPGHGVLCSIQGPTVNSWYYQSHQPSQSDYIVEGKTCFNIKISFGSIGITMIMRRQFWDHSDSKVHGANMGPTWGRQDPGGPHVGPMNFAIWDLIFIMVIRIWIWQHSYHMYY